MNSILWCDDEIELLKPQILFLQDKGYKIIEVSNGVDAIEKVGKEIIDVVFLDEQMPGLSGLETLTRIKSSHPHLPVVMITKNEEENIMEEAIGSQISDYLIKPVKSNQILLTLKKILDTKHLVSEKTTSNYQQEFRQIFNSFNENPNYEEWMEIYKKLIFWELELDKSKNDSMREVLVSQKQEANKEFCKYVSRNYLNWIKNPADAPTLSNTLMRFKVFPFIEPDVPTFMILMDNLRFDQWKMIEPILNENFRVVSEDSFFSILPTTTQYSRNAIFSGLMPAEIDQRYPNMWVNDEEEGGKNLHEYDLLKEQILRMKKNLKTSYTKITTLDGGKTMVSNMNNMMQNNLNVIVYNFIDMLSHARTEMEVLKELAPDENAYREITKTWFNNSPLHEALVKIADKKVNLIITTDHGSMRVKEPVKVIGDRDTSTNLRYKHGKNLSYNAKELFEIKKPEEAKLPKPHNSSTFIFAREDDFFVYPNNYNQHVNMYRNTFQHGGMSMEEMIIPVVRLVSK